MDINQHMLFSLFFTEDQEMVTSSRDDLEEALKALEKECSLWGLQINFERTKYLRVNCKEAMDRQINGSECKKVDSFEYLGLTIDGNGELELEVRRRAGLARRLTRMLHPVL
ncbi:uncharacterized protein [Halyomorpha halys]|uniref:uncharacterized protein n=1 Tax=Halyomorpha halys TaxID=286706 RepID=UPI0006D50182|nr:uncharacterized protein LOC106689276 [Halyomorpha halys]